MRFDFKKAAREGGHEPGPRIGHLKQALRESVLTAGWNWIGPGSRFDPGRVAHALIVGAEAWSEPDWSFLDALRSELELVFADFRPRKSPAVALVGESRIMMTWSRPTAEQVLAAARRSPL